MTDELRDRADVAEAPVSAEGRGATRNREALSRREVMKGSVGVAAAAMGAAFLPRSSHAPAASPAVGSVASVPPAVAASDLAASDLAASDLAASDLAASDLAASDLAASGQALPATASPAPVAPAPPWAGARSVQRGAVRVPAGDAVRLDAGATLRARSQPRAEGAEGGDLRWGQQVEGDKPLLLEGHRMCSMQKRQGAHGPPA